MFSIESTIALKEWQIVIDSLLLGAPPLLIRKGGIREQGDSFECPHSHALLLPTFEHQRLSVLKETIQCTLGSRKTEILSANETPNGNSSPKQLLFKLSAWVEFTAVFPIQTCRQLQRLDPLHMWTETFVASRFDWKPDRPLWGMLCRVHRFSEPIYLEAQPNFRGCRSWVELPQLSSRTESCPVWSDQDYQIFANKVLTTVDCS